MDDYNSYLERRAIAKNTSRNHRKIERVGSLAEWVPVFENVPHQPPALRSNGGIRGSAATSRRTLRENF